MLGSLAGDTLQKGLFTPTNDELREAIQELIAIRGDSDDDELERTMAVPSRYSKEEAERIDVLLNDYRNEIAAKAWARTIRRLRERN